MATDQGRQVPAARTDSALVWFSSSDPSQAKPAGASVTTCFINVPFAHRLRAAHWSHGAIKNTSAIVASLNVADDDDAVAGSAIASYASSDLATAAGSLFMKDITVTSTMEIAGTAGRTYWMALSGVDASDLVDSPALTIGVEPVTRSRL